MRRAARSTGVMIPALVCLAFGLPAPGASAQPATATATTAVETFDPRLAARLRTLNRPLCFGYSAAAEDFACLDFGFQADDLGAFEVTPSDFERFRAPRRDVSWGGHKSVLFVGEGRTIEISAREYADRARIVRTRSLRSAVRAAEAQGYRDAVSAITLGTGSWVRAGAFWLRFETRFHDGDASAYAIGSLRLACTDPSAGEPRAVELLDDRRGAVAFAFTAAGASSIAVGVLREGGGEGSGYTNTRYLRIDDTLCP